MTQVNLDSVGLCAHYSSQGDWAFDLALEIVQERNLQLNIFYFLENPFDPSDLLPSNISYEEKRRLSIERERKLRFTYDERLKDHLRVGFRVCERQERLELHKCLLNREFQLLVVPCPEKGIMFGNVTVEEFAAGFISPTLLVGPDFPRQVCYNKPAGMMLDKLGVDYQNWETLSARNTTPVLELIQ